MLPLMPSSERRSGGQLPQPAAVTLAIVSPGHPSEMAGFAATSADSKILHRLIQKSRKGD